MVDHERWPIAHHDTAGELLLALVSRKLADLPTLCSAMCVCKDARQTVLRKCRPSLAYRIGRPRCVFDGREQALQQVAQQCFWLGNHADLILYLEVCSTVILDSCDVPISADTSARAAEDIICAALLHPKLKVQKLHLGHTYCPANIIQRLQHPKFLTSLSVDFHSSTGLNSTFCTSLGLLQNLQQLQFQCDCTNKPAAFTSLPLATAAFSSLLQLTRLSLGVLTSAAAVQCLPEGLIWLEVAYLSTGASISHMTRLETLLLQNPDLHADDLTAAVNSLASLTKLEISYSSFLSFAPENHAAAWLAMPKLHTLNLWYSKPHINSSWALANPTQLCRTLYENVAATLQQCTGLVSLAIGFDCWQLQEVGAAQMLASLSHLQRLAIGVGGDGINPFGLGYSGIAVLANISRLRALVLDIPTMSQVELQQVAAATQLTALQLSCDQVDNALVQSIASTNQRLRVLGVGGRCQVSLAAIGDLLSSTCLRYLEQVAVGPSKENPFQPVHSSIVHSNAGAAAIPTATAWDHSEPGLIDTCGRCQVGKAYEDGYENMAFYDGDAGESGWLEMLQEARPGVTISRCVSLKFGNIVYTGESAF